MSVQRQFQGVIFDFNGTLFWDTDKHTAAWKLLSEQLRGTPFTDRELRENVHGRTNPIILEYLLNGPVDPETFEKLSLQKEEFYRALCLKSPGCLKLADGAEELLEELRTHGVPFAIATSSERSNLDFYLEHLPLARWFPQERIIYDNGTFRGKPNPDIYLIAAQRLGLPPASCLVVEDAPSGIEAARRAGVGGIIAIASDRTTAHFDADVLAVLHNFRDFDRSLLFAS